MLHATAHDIMLSGKMDLLEPFQIRRETIMLVNERLAYPIQSINDVTNGSCGMPGSLRGQWKTYPLSE
jgi:hypothetical protein